MLWNFDHLPLDSRDRWQATDIESVLVIVLSWSRDLCRAFNHGMDWTGGNATNCHVLSIESNGWELVSLCHSQSGVFHGMFTKKRGPFLGHPFHYVSLSLGFLDIFGHTPFPSLFSSWATHMPAPFIWEEGRSRHQLKKHTRKQESLKAILRCPFHCQGFQNGSGQDREGTLERRHCIAMIGKFMHGWIMF